MSPCLCGLLLTEKRELLPVFEDVELGDEIGPMETEATNDDVEAFCRV